MTMKHAKWCKDHQGCSWRCMQPTCRGCAYLGTACRKCEHCRQSRDPFVARASRIWTYEAEQRLRRILERIVPLRLWSHVEAIAARYDCWRYMTGRSYRFAQCWAILAPTAATRKHDERARSRDDARKAEGKRFSLAIAETIERIRNSSTN